MSLAAEVRERVEAADSSGVLRKFVDYDSVVAQIEDALEKGTKRPAAVSGALAAAVRHSPFAALATAAIANAAFAAP